MIMMLPARILPGHGARYPSLRPPATFAVWHPGGCRLFFGGVLQAVRVTPLAHPAPLVSDP